MKMKLAFYGLALFSVGALVAPRAMALDYNWIVAGPADWAGGENWDQGAAPQGGGGNHAHVNNGGTAVISADIGDIQDIFVGVGGGSTGTLDQTGGATFQGTGSWMFVGQDGGTGTYNLSGGTQNKERLYIGRGGGGNGTLNVSGTGVVGGALLIAGVDGGHATVSFTETGSTNTSGNVEFHNADVTITDSAAIVAHNEVWVGNGGGNTTTANMDSGTMEADTWIAIGRGSSNGTLNLSGTASITKHAIDDGLETVSDSEGGFIVVGAQGSGGVGTLNISGEATVHSDTGLGLNETAGQVGIVNQSGGSVTVHDYAPKDFQANLGQSLNIDMNGHGEGEYHMTGGTLNAETVKVGNGWLEVNDGSFNANVVTIGDTGLLSGSGNLNANVEQDGGTVSPGNSPGTMTITGNYSLNSGDLFMELDGTTAGTGYDQLIVTGDVSLAGDLALSVGFAPSMGDMFKIIDNQGANPVSGLFSQGYGISADGYTFAIDYTGGDGNDVVLTRVPEPTTLALLAGLGLVGFAVRRRR